MIKGIRDDLMAQELENEFLEEEKKAELEETKSAMMSSMRSPMKSEKSAGISAAKKKKEGRARENIALIKNSTSLLYRFESCGFNYQKQKDSKILTYRDIEKVLILFRNSYNVSEFRRE